MKALAAGQGRRWRLPWWLRPWHAARTLRAGNERLIQALADPVLTGVRIGNGTLDVGMEDFAGAQLMAGMFLGMFESHPEAVNYMEVRFRSSQGDVLVTVVRPEGRTPDQMRRLAESERDVLRAEVRRLRDRLEQRDGA